MIVARRSKCCDCPHTLLHVHPAPAPLADGAGASGAAGEQCGWLVRMQGYHGDTSRMFFVGDVPEKARKLCEVTKQAMEAGIRQCGPGVPVKNIGKVRPPADTNF